MSFHGRDEHGHTEDVWHPQVKRHIEWERKLPKIQEQNSQRQK